MNSDMYVYEQQKAFVLTDEGQRTFLKIRDHVHKLLEEAGAVRMQEAMKGTGDSWDLMACVDRLVELGELREVTTGKVAGQHRIFVKGRG